MACLSMQYIDIRRSWLSSGDSFRPAHVTGSPSFRKVQQIQSVEFCTPSVVSALVYGQFTSESEPGQGDTHGENPEYISPQFERARNPASSLRCRIRRRVALAHAAVDCLTSRVCRAGRTPTEESNLHLFVSAKLKLARILLPTEQRHGRTRFLLSGAVLRQSAETAASRRAFGECPSIRHQESQQRQARRSHHRTLSSCTSLGRFPSILHYFPR